MANYERLLLGVNPASSNAHRAPAILDNLQNGGLGIHVEQVETVTGGLAANQERFAGILRPGDLLVTVGGDGGDREMVSSLLIVDDELAREVTTTTLGGGEASDKFHALHGKRGAVSPTKLIQRGVRRACRPIRTVIEGHGATQEYPAYSQAGFNKSANAAARINTRAYREQGRLRREAGILGYLVFGDDTFTVQNLTPRPSAIDDIEALAELSAMISSPVAKYGKPPVRPWEESMFCITLEPGALRAAAGLVGLATGHPIGQQTLGPISFRTLTSVRAHFDGEAEVVAADSQVTIDRHPRAINTLVSPEQCLPSHLIPPDPDAPYIHLG